MARTGQGSYTGNAPEAADQTMGGGGGRGERARGTPTRRGIEVTSESTGEGARGQGSPRGKGQR